MEDRVKTLQRLRDFNSRISAGDAELAEETLDRRAPPAAAARAGDDFDQAMAAESIVMRRHRPVLRVIGDTTELVFASLEDSEIWKARLTAAQAQIVAAIKAVGRINLTGAPWDWVGTGWLVRDNIIVTNRHVAEEFVSTGGAGLTFLPSVTGAPVQADVDFLKEFENTATRAFRLIAPLYVAPRGGPDIAFFEIEQISHDGQLSAPIKLSAYPRETNRVATVGYPAFDSRIPDIALMEEIYGNQYNKKRLAPGSSPAGTRLA